MAVESKTFLAASVLNDGKIISYRTLSRESKVHSNVAKKILYEFHRVQNSKHPGSVHATYIVDGVRKITQESGVNGLQHDGEYVHIQSSPYMSSSMPHEDEDVTPPRTIILARERELEAVKTTFNRIYSIYIYSLGPSPVQNLQILSECNQTIAARFANEDPLLIGKVCGVIQNAGVKRRMGRRPNLVAPPVLAAKGNDRAKHKSQESSRPSTANTKCVDRPSSSGKSSRSTPQAETKLEVKVEHSKNANKKPASKLPPMRREQSDIFKSFSKPKVAKLKREDTESSNDASPVPTIVKSENASIHEDEPMHDASEDEQIDDSMETGATDLQSRMSQSQRAEQLRKMMEDEDEEMEATAENPHTEAQVSAPGDKPTAPDESSPEPPVVVGRGRRHGRRKVMKKKTIKDEEGYLVTKEEPAWESFSEDEPPLQKDRIHISSATLSTVKNKKTGGKPGQGSIMSFFGKK
ncbi:hypothetical protein MMC28_004682 [Mycoblastus sanguinarius]|nr:hypothetical protein [Mycoblastus sanguinarius]